MEFKFLFNDRETHEMAAALVKEDSCNFRLSQKYQIYYRFLRPIMPIAIRQLLQRRRKIEVDDDWYQPGEFLHSLAKCLATDQDQATDQDRATVHPWPQGARFAFVLTHDVETAEGMQHINRIAEAEERLGFRSSWNLIPYKYKIDMGLVRDLQSRGFEIGIHGYNHDGQLYRSKREFERRVPAINDAIRKYGAVGFRSPMVHRNLDWLQSLDVEYESSCFDVDPFQAAPGGVGQVWPFIAGKFVELPYTLPQDHTLFVGLGERDDRIWRNKLDFIIRHQGMALMLTHPDYLTQSRESEIYLRFLEHVAERGQFWHALPKDVARWWRKREQAMAFAGDGKKSGLADDDSPLFADLQLDHDGIQFINRQP